MNTRYIFVTGAAKAGTTSLAEQLALADDVCLSSPKEPDFFARNYDKGFAWYDDVFNNDSAGIRVDASTSYMAGFNGSCVDYLQRIKEFDCEKKFVYVVRDPIERTWSSYWHGVRAGWESKSFHEALVVPNSPHIESSLYYKRLVEFNSVFNSNDIKVINFRELVENSDYVLKDLRNYLSLEQTVIPNQTVSKSNASFQWRGPGKILNALPTPILKKINTGIKRVLPAGLFSRLKSSISKPIPVMNVEQARLIREFVEADTIQFEKTYKMGVRENAYWFD